MNYYRAEQQAYNGCRSILKLADSYSPRQLEEACEKALKHLSLPRYKNIKLIIQYNQDTRQVNQEDENNDDFAFVEVHHIMEETQMNRDTYEKIVALRLPGMAKTYLEQEEMEDIRQLTFDQRLELLVDAEVDSQRIHKIERLINNAHFAESKASITQIKYYADRHLDKEQILNLATNEYIKKHENVLIIGATGAGKSYIGCALGVEACNSGLKVKYIRLPDLLS